MTGFNQQYNYARPDSLSVRIATRVRNRMFARFMAAFSPSASDSVLDIGVTGDRSFQSSNYFEALYPHKQRITACGLDEAGFLEKIFPGLTYCKANALELPFGDQSFDYVHCSAVWEHVGNSDNQSRMLEECLRVAQRGVMLTTPNRWFPIEFHSQLPLVHWLPKPAFRRVLLNTRFRGLADESVLNLLTPREVDKMASAHKEWLFTLDQARLLLWPSNILLIGHRRL